MNEVQVLQIPHARRDLRRHVDETVETETTTERREFPATKLRYSHSRILPTAVASEGFLRGVGRRETRGGGGGRGGARCASLTINKRVKLSRWRNLLRVNSDETAVCRK